MSELIIGVGNVLLKDEGVGVRCIEYMKSRGLGNGAKLVDGATLGLDLLEEISGQKNVVIVDAVDMGKEPGHIASFDAEALLQLPSGKRLSLHEISLIDVIHVGRKIGRDFSNVRIVGIQPKEVSRGEGLSDVIERKLPALSERVLKELDKERSD